MPEQLKIIIDADAQPASTELRNFGKVFVGEFNKINQSANTSVTGIQKSIDSLKGQLGGVKFNIDTSDLDKIENKLSSIQIKSLHLDFELTGETEVNKAIRSIRERFSALRLNPDRSLFDALIADINKLKTNDILLHVDNSQALSEINKVATLAQNIRGEIIVTANIDQSLSNIKTRIESLQGVDLKLNPTDAILQVDRVLNEIVQIRNQEILLNVNNSDALGKINQLEGLAKNIRANIQINATGFAEAQKGAVSLADRFSEAEKRIHASVDKMVDDALSGANKIKSAFGNIGDLRVDVQATGALKTVSGLNSFQSALGKSTTAITQLQAKGAGLNSFFANLSAASGKAATSLSRLPSSTNSASFAMLNFGRVIQDAPFGILGIANNLNPLIESMQRASVAAKETGTSLTKNLLGSLKGAGGIGLAVSAVSSLLIVFGDKLFGAGKKADEAAEKIRSFGQIVDDSTAGVQGDIAQVNALVKAFGDTSSFEKQKRILLELKDINKNYFGDLEAGKSTFKDITKAANAYTDALVQQAIVKGLQDEIGVLAKQLRDAKRAYKELAVETANAKTNLENITRAERTNVQGLTAQNQKVNSATNAYNAMSVKSGKALEKVVELTTGFNNLTKEISEAVGVQLKFKPLDGGDLKDDTDKIIARARQFVREFGDAFVVPDLEDSFFKTKQELLKQSKKLLDDVAKGKLKIKIPVQLDFDLLPIEEFTLQQSTIDNFFKAIKIEKGVSIDVPIDLNFITKDQTKQIDDLVKQFAVLGDFGIKEFAKIDFSNINSGISEATKRLEGMMAIATTLNQAIGQGLSNAFNSVFDAVLEGKNVFKALGNAVKELIVTTIKAVAQMLILRLVTNAIFPGAGAAGGGVGRLIGGLGGAANFGISSGIGSRAFSNVITVNVNGQISGDTILLAGQRAANSQGRFGG